jgi:hypothetical protein
MSDKILQSSRLVAKPCVLVASVATGSATEFSSILTSAPGYEPKFATPPGHDRTTSRSRRSKSNVCFFGFSSAVPPGADAQDGGAVGPYLTRSGNSASAESAAQWDTFLTDVYRRRGLRRDTLFLGPLRSPACLPSTACVVRLCLARVSKVGEAIKRTFQNPRRRFSWLRLRLRTAPSTSG